MSLESGRFGCAAKLGGWKIVAGVQVLHVALEAVVASSLHVERCQVKSLNAGICSTSCLAGIGIFEEVIEDLGQKYPYVLYYFVQQG